MCGVAGAVMRDALDAERAVEAMCGQMIARGPDDGGVVTFATDGSAAVLGNRRLAIIDPSPAGHQPMADPERGTAIVYNGMIYNQRELRAELIAAGERFASDCDTEVVLKAYGRWGARCVPRLRGMFAFAVWDTRAREMFLARDRLGIKPMYYADTPAGFAFASQVKALLASGLVEPRLSRAGVASYLAYGAVREPLTAIDGVLSLPAAHTATLRGGRLTLEHYWRAPDVAERAVSRDDAARELRALLEDSVRRHLVADAPLGVFLSGGVDSSLLAALAARERAHVRTVSVAFDDAAYSEASFQDLVARHIGSEHVRVTLRPDDVLAWRDDVFRAMDQPTFDGLNTYGVSRAAAGAGLKVALSGLGADELFDGYGHVARVRALERARRLPPPVAAVAARAAGATMRDGNREKIAAWLAGRAGDEPHDLLRRLFLDDEVRRLSPACEPPAPAALDPATAGLSGRDLHAQVATRELSGYLRDVLLRDTDAMSMRHSLEVRVSYLDAPLVDWALALPPHLKTGGKALLAEATRDLLPPAIFSRRKQGFGLPLARWMAGDLREEIEATLRRPPDALAGLLDPDAALDVWRHFLLDGRRWQRPWALYALCRWAETIAAREAVGPAREVAA